MPFSVLSPTIQEKQEYNWRGITRDDLPEIWELFQIVNEVDGKDNSESLDDLRQQFDDPWSSPLRDGRVVRTIKGKLAAFARVFVNPEPQKENVAVVWCEVAPEAREDGLELECLDWMEDRAVDRLAVTAQVPGARELPRVVRAFLDEDNASSVDLYQAHGFEHVRSFYQMDRDLDDPIPDNPLPEGLTLRTYSEELDDSMRGAFNEAFGDHWGNQPVTPEEWHPFIMDVSNVRRDLTLVVMDGTEVVAFAINVIKTDENERLGIRRGWIGSLGTRRRYRKQGIASALLAESMRRFHAEGLDTAGLGADSENLTGALALYERLGFKAYKTKLALDKRVG